MMPEHDDQPPPSPTPEEVVASVRPVPPAPVALPPDPPTETATAQPARGVPSHGVDVASLGINTPIGRLDARAIGLLVASMLGGAVLGQTVLPALGLSVEPVEVRDVRISAAECAARLDMAEQRQARTEARLISAEQSVAEARTGLRDLMEACTR